MSRANVGYGRLPPMYRDKAAGHRVEAEQIVGDMVRGGAGVGIATPLLKAAYIAFQVYQANLLGAD